MSPEQGPVFIQGAELCFGPRCRPKTARYQGRGTARFPGTISGAPARPWSQYKNGTGPALSFWHQTLRYRRVWSGFRSLRQEGERQVKPRRPGEFSVLHGSLHGNDGRRRARRSRWRARKNNSPASICLRRRPAQAVRAEGGTLLLFASSCSTVAMIACRKKASSMA